MFGSKHYDDGAWLHARLGLLGLLLLSVCVGCGGGQSKVRTIRTMSVAKELVGVWYTVQAGDSLELIAQRHKVAVSDIVEINGIIDPSRISVGQPLFLYGVETLMARLDKTSKKKRKRRKRRSRGGLQLVWPLKKGVLTSGYGPRGRRVHKGIDLAAKPGTPIFAVADGTVIYSDNKQRGYGNLVIVEHEGRTVSVYAHNRRNLVDEGDRVGQGSPIAEVGNTGRSTGPHLHFELRVKGRAVNPLDYLPAR